MSDPGAVPRCDHAVGCVTCGDEAIAMRVVRFDRRRDLALCRNEGRTRTVDTLLVGAVAPGEVLLVHADVALQRLLEEQAP